MYVPKPFAELRINVMHELIWTYPLATLVTLSASGLNANHIPLDLVETPVPLGTLRGHVARDNPLHNELATDLEVLAVFHGPAGYITPSWYAAKQETGKVVPTWNYAVVHAYGVLKIVDDASWLRTHLNALTAQNESRFPQPWAVADAPPEFIEKLIGKIVGIEIVITRLIGKWKMSQNQPLAHQLGVIAGLKENGSSQASTLAALVATVAKDLC